MGSMVRIVLAVTVVLFTAAPASAITLRAPATRPTARAAAETVHRYVDTARAAWPDSPCTGRERIVVYALPDGDDGLASDWLCLVEIDSALTGTALCRVLVHEFGHLAGRDHSDDPANIMSTPAADVPYQPCDRAARRAEPVPADLVAAWWIIDGARRGTRVHCPRPAQRAPVTLRCSVRDRWGKQHDWRVRVTGTAYGDIAIR